VSFSLEVSAPNIFPSKYRSVAVASVDFSLGHSNLRDHFVGKEAYMRTRFIVVRSGPQTTLVEVAKEDDLKTAPDEPLFSRIVDIRVLAEPDECVFLTLPDIDVGVPAHMATATLEAKSARCVIVEGRYCHISFLLNPTVTRINVLDIVPPAPSKLLDQVERVLDIAEDLPPIAVTGETVSSLELLQAAAESGSGPDERSSVLLPCRGPGLDIDGVSVAYLDQRPERQDWTLLGCARSQQIHRWFYQSTPGTVDTCPRQFLGSERDDQGATLSRCCLLQNGMEATGRTVLVPWGSSLPEVRAAVEALVDIEGSVWTPI